MVSNSTGLCFLLTVVVKASSLLKGGSSHITVFFSGCFLYLVQAPTYSISPEPFILASLLFCFDSGIVTSIMYTKQLYKFYKQLGKRFADKAPFKYYNLTLRYCGNIEQWLSLNYTKLYTFSFDKQDIRFSIFNMKGYATQWH